MEEKISPDLKGDPGRKTFRIDFRTTFQEENINRVKPEEELEPCKGGVFDLNLASYLCIDSVSLNPQGSSYSKPESLKEFEASSTMIYATGNMGGLVSLIFWNVEPEEVEKS